MTDWHFFQALLGQLTAALQVGGNAMSNGAIGYVRPVLLIAITAWIAFQAICVANGVATFRSLYHGILRAALIVFLLQSVATYNQYVVSLAQAIPTEVGNALAAVGANRGNVANGAVFDDVWNAAGKAGLAVFDHIPKYSLSSIPLWFAVIVYLAIALVAIGVSFLVYLASTILLQLLLAVGPLFVAMFVFPQTQKFASGWVAGVASTVVTQILAVAILVMFVGVEQATVTRITTGVSGGAAANFIDEIITLSEAALLMWLISTLVKQAPSFAGSIAHGVYQNVSGALGAAGNAAGGAVKMATNGIAMGGRGVSAVTRRAATGAARVSQPTGRSLSGG